MYARGAIFGLTRDTGKDHIIKATLADFQVKTAGTGVALATYDMTGWWILPAMALAGILFYIALRFQLSFAVGAIGCASRYSRFTISVAASRASKASNNPSLLPK